MMTHNSLLVLTLTVTEGTYSNRQQQRGSKENGGSRCTDSCAAIEQRLTARTVPPATALFNRSIMTTLPEIKTSQFYKNHEGN